MLSTLPKLADRAFVVGFLLPSLLFTVGLLVLFSQMEQVLALLKPTKEENSTTALVLLAVAVWLLAVLMQVLNHWLYRSLEGYLPPLSWRRRASMRYSIKTARMRKEALALGREWAAKGDRFPRQSRQRYRALLLRLAGRPPRRHALPTAFGNAIKTFETYPEETYGADGVRLWPHVAAVAPKPLVEATTETRAQVDFMVNMTFFSLLVAICGAAKTVCEVPWSDAMAAIRAHEIARALSFLPRDDVVWCLGTVAAGWCFYKLAVALIPAWGQAVKACFDVGLPALATQLGFTLPKTEAERRRFWQSFSQALIYRTNPDFTPMFSPEDWLPKQPDGLLRRLLRLFLPAAGRD
ncbi:MAG: hypothetical protein JOZ42_00355 [Acetobacteraceae bacterium]|nr:hypothetical protein [Acetobacteraceae bacterium]